jgi:glycine dehydrogenase subunit 2
MSEPLIFEMSRPGRRAWSLPECDVPASAAHDLLPAGFLEKTPPPLPEVSLRDLVGHFTRLSQKNFCVDTHFYPLGSCTMKFNPKVNDVLASLMGFTETHPYAPELAPGIVELLASLGEALCEITGMDAVSLQPSAGAHGELTGLLMVQAYHEARGGRRKFALVPDSAHGTNPASCVLAGFDVREVKSGRDGLVDMKSFRKELTRDVAVMMITNPNTLGLFEKNILAISHELHDAGALLYLDGANLNAVMGVTRPGDFGVDVMHLNLHKTFGTPHGAGGPGAGPVAVKNTLAPYLPTPIVRRDASGRAFLDDDRPHSIGKVRTFHGNVGVLVRAYAYIRTLGAKGLREAAELSVLNANYLLKKLVGRFPVPYGERCMHEFVATGEPLLKHGVRTLDVAKRLIDYGMHPPTIYFPLIVKEALMVEPTETESKETLDRFGEIMLKIAEEAEKSPELLKTAPNTTEFSRFDEVAAARSPRLTWKPPTPETPWLPFEE